MLYSLFSDFLKEDINPKEIDKYEKSKTLSAQLEEMLQAKIIGKFDSQGHLVPPNTRHVRDIIDIPPNTEIEMEKKAPEPAKFTYKVIDENGEAKYSLLEKNLLFLYNAWKSGQIQHANPVIQLNQVLQEFEECKKRNRIPKDITGTPIYDKVNYDNSKPPITDIKNTPLHKLDFRQLFAIVDEYGQENLSGEALQELPPGIEAEYVQGVSAPFAVVHLRTKQACISAFIALGDRMSKGRWCVNPRSSYCGYKDGNSSYSNQEAIKTAEGHAHNYFRAYKDGLYIILKNKNPFALFSLEKPELNNTSNSPLTLLEMQDVKDHWKGLIPLLKKNSLFHYLQDISETKVKVETFMKKLMKDKYGKQRVVTKKLTDVFKFHNDKLIQVFKTKDPQSLIDLYGNDFGLTTPESIKAKLRNLLEILANAKVDIVPEIEGSLLTFKINTDSNLQASFDIVMNQMERKLEYLNNNHSSVAQKYGDGQGNIDVDRYLYDAVDDILTDNDPLKSIINKINDLEIIVGPKKFKGFLEGNGDMMLSEEVI